MISVFLVKLKMVLLLASQQGNQYHINQFLTKNKEIILITDGSNNSGNIDPITGARLAKENNIKIHTIVVGSDNSIVRISGRGMISNDIDTETLKKISKITNGEFLGRNPKIKLNFSQKLLISINIESHSIIILIQLAY